MLSFFIIKNLSFVNNALQLSSYNCTIDMKDSFSNPGNTKVLSAEGYNNESNGSIPLWLA